MMSVIVFRYPTDMTVERLSDAIEGIEGTKGVYDVSYSLKGTVVAETDSESISEAISKAAESGLTVRSLNTPMMDAANGAIPKKKGRSDRGSVFRERFGKAIHDFCMEDDPPADGKDKEAEP